MGAKALLTAAMFIATKLLLLVNGADNNAELLSDINAYRSKLGAPPLASNAGAACLADKLANQFGEQPCDNVTEAQTSPGLEPDLPNYPTLLKDCHLQLPNTTQGQVLVDCIPASLASDAASTAAQNFTRSQEYQMYVNSTDYTSAGVGSHKLWFVLVLAKNSSDANYAQQRSNAAPTTGYHLGAVVLAAVAAAAVVLVHSQV